MNFDIEDLDWDEANKDDLITAVKISLLFGGYIKQMNPDLHSRARDFAMDNINPNELHRFLEGMNTNESN